MKANFFAMAQGQVAQTVEESPSLSHGMNGAAVKRCARMISIGALAASAFVTAMPSASAQTAEQVLSKRFGDAARQVVGNQTRSGQGGNEAGQLVDLGVRAATGQRMNEGLSVTIPAVASALLLRLAKPNAKPAAYAVAGAIGAGGGYLYNQTHRSEGQSGQAQYINGQQTTGPAFYSPRDLGMPEKFTQVSQLHRIGMIQPGQIFLDLRDGTQTSNNLVRAIDQLQHSLQTHRQSQAHLNEARLSPYPLAPQQVSQTNKNFAASSVGVDRAIESYIRMSNNAGLQNRDTHPFNMLAAKMVHENLAPDQQVNMSVNARMNPYPR